jgi:hypothetical protein
LLLLVFGNSVVSQALGKFILREIL